MTHPTVRLYKTNYKHYLKLTPFPPYATPYTFKFPGCNIQVDGVHPLINGVYTMMSVQCNKMPVWSKACNGSKSGDVTTNMCYIYQKEYGLNKAWSLSPNFCTDDWMTSCQMYSRNEKYNCRSHPKNELGLMHFEQVGWPWEEKRWKDNYNWWKTVKMTCLSESSNSTAFIYHVAIFFSTNFSQ